MPIYKEYNQDALDRQYNNRLNAPDHERHLLRWELLSRETEKKYRVIKSIPYGGLPDEKLDIFPSEQAHAKTLVFIHGGYWYKHIAADFYLIAEAFRSYGFTTVLIDYPLMPAYSLDQLVKSCRRSIQWVQQNIAAYNGDPSEIYVAGHSAGGHLASMTMTGEESNTAVKAVFAISGLYNLQPVQLCYVNETIHLDKETALRNSPVNLSPVVSCPLLLAVGANESAEYLEQSRELYTSWSKQNANVELLEIPGADHFSILETMLVPSSPLHKAMCSLMNS
jgi:arylformamidase